MRKTFCRLSLAMVLALTFVLSGCGNGQAEGNGKAEGRPELKSVKDKISYSIGLDIGSGFVAQEMDIDADLLALGIKHAVSQAEPLLTEEEMNEAIMAFQDEMMSRQEAMMDAERTQNLQAGQQFLAENAERDEVVALASGLQYRVLSSGDGATPSADDVVSVHYEGRLIDGTIFDSSLERGEPAVFPVAGVIPGWTEALQLMQVGDKWEIFLPADLAYGERGVPPVIGPNSVLIFSVELLAVNP
ncbi:FKBP-type peptidyl-prolyl cis-trans isomerase [Desulfurivibrio sp. C05AmB]|uniref:FKBP-type peptidyl-prolyl cis-trans isomerase n=1 Tax=Desulfurivibrio sp. C05AmB TaxID=3374371 RepID=UPI00376EFD8B